MLRRALSKLDLRHVAAPTLCLLASLFMVLPVAVRSGWPYNHEYASPFERVEAYRRAFVAFDFFPTWSPFCFNGHGTPSPLIYHRLFSWVGALIAVPLGADLGTRVALVAFGAWGAVGLYRVARRLEVRPALALPLAIAFLWSPYSLTDWLVRGAVAEFALMMVLPWLLDALLAQLEGEQIWARLGVALAAVMHAHQSVGLYVAPLAVFSVGIAMGWPATPRRLVLLDALKAGALSLALTVPWLIAVWRVGPAFRLDALKVFVPWEQYVPWQRYVMDNFAWGHTFSGFSIELSRWLLMSLGVALFAALLTRAKVRRWREALLLVLAFSWAAVLQFDVATPLFRAIPNAELLQFPWRLLAILTPVACLLTGLLLEGVSRAGPRWAALGFALVAAVAVRHAMLVRTAEALDYPSYDAGGLLGKIGELDGPHSAGEYLPRATPTVPPASSWVSASGCTLKHVTPAEPAHFRRLEVELEPGPACRLTFSQFASPILAVEGDGTPVAAPFVTVDVPAGGRHVVLRPRGLFELWRVTPGI